MHSVVIPDFAGRVHGAMDPVGAADIGQRLQVAAMARQQWSDRRVTGAMQIRSEWAEMGRVPGEPVQKDECFAVGSVESKRGGERVSQAGLGIHVDSTLPKRGIISVVRRLALSFLLVLAACGSPPQTAVFLEGDFDVPEEFVTAEVPAEEMRYLLRFPEGWSPGAQLPLVVFLHGSGDDDYDSRWLTGYGIPAALQFGLIPDGVEPFVLLAPQATPGTSWDMGRQPETVLALVDQVVADHGLDPERVSLTGVSMGGYGTWQLATRFPDRFVTAASVSGSGYGFTELPADLNVCALSEVAIRAYHGSDDQISLLSLNQQVIGAWEERCDASFDLSVLDGEGHFTTAETVYTDAAFYNWLLTG